MSATPIAPARVGWAGIAASTAPIARGRSRRARSSSSAARVRPPEGTAARMPAVSPAAPLGKRKTRADQYQRRAYSEHRNPAQRPTRYRIHESLQSYAPLICK